MKLFSSSWSLRCALLVLPIAFAATGGWLAQQRGPLWLAGNSDPSYQYLLNSLLILNGQPPCHIDHPGTTVQTLSAVILSVTTAGKSRDEQTLAILSDPERALARLHFFFLTVSAIAFTVAGLAVLEYTGSLTMAFAVQLTPLLQLATYQSTLFVAPETLLTALTTLMVALLVVRESGATSATGFRKEIPISIFLGLLVAAGLVTKITFAPLCTLPFLMSRSWRGALWTAGAFVGGTSLFLVPIASQLPRMFDWFHQLATHQGIYGSGATGFVDLSAYPGNIVMLLNANRVLVGVAIGGLVVAGVTFASRPESERVRRWAHLLFVVTTVQVIAVLLVAKHPRPHYLLPAALSTALNVALAFQIIAAWPQEKRRRTMYVTAGVALATASIILFVHLPQFSRRLRQARDLQLEQTRHADEIARDGVRVDYYRSSSLAFALYFANGSAWRLYAEPLARLHPGHIFFNAALGRFETYSGRLAVTDVFHNDKLFLAGDGSIEHLPPGVIVPLPQGWRMTLIDRTGDATVHLLQKAE